MKNTILKIAGVRDLESFYRKFPNEESFMKKHGKEFQAKCGANLKKAEGGLSLGANNFNVPDQNQWMQHQNDISGLSPMDKMRINPAQTQGYSPQPFSTQIPQQSMWDATTPKKGFDWDNAMTKGIPVVGDLMKGFSQLKQEKKQLKKATQWNQVSDVVRQASALDPEEQVRQYVGGDRDGGVDANALYPSYGTGTVLKDGGELQPIQPNRSSMEKQQLIPMDNYWYRKDSKFRANGPSYFEEAQRLDSEYGIAKGKLKTLKSKPAINKWKGRLTEIDNLKIDLLTHQASSMKNGGDLKKANFGEMLGAFDQAGGTDKLSGYMTELTGENGGGTIGGTVGGQAGQMIGGPAGKVIGQLAGQGLGSLIDRMPYKTEKQQNSMYRNINTAAMNDWSNNRDSSFMKAGGELKQNAVEVEGGEPAVNTDTGIISNLNGPKHENGGFDIAFDGDIQLLENKGNVKPISSNPYLKDGEGKLEIFGDLKPDKELLDLADLSKYKGKGKFKNIIKGISKEENKINKKLDNSMKALSKLKVDSSHSKLEFSSHKANILGANMKLKADAEDIHKLGSLQKAINDSKEEFQPTAKDGKTIKAEDGIPIPKEKEGVDQKTYDMLVGFYNRAKTSKDTKVIGKYRELYNKFYPGKEEKIVRSEVPSNLAKEQGITSEQLQDPNTSSETVLGTNNNMWGIRNEQLIPYRNPEWDNTKPLSFDEINYDRTQKEIPQSTGGYDNEPQPIDNKALKANMLGQMLPYLRPSDAEELDPRQLAGEMYSLSNNQLEGVPAQKYSPDLGTPYDISLQDQLNANQGDYNAVKRTMGYNPAALSVLNAQKYKANSSVLGEQFRLNQGMKDKVYGENRNTLNDAKFKNLQILDNQYTRQSQAKSNTKATKQLALQSIGDKFMQNQLNNRTLQTYENMYNYRYDDKMRAWNMNAPAQFNTQGDGSTKGSSIPEGFELDSYKRDDSGNWIPSTLKRKSANGTILKAFKTY